jgi:hypothetical protein
MIKNLTIPIAPWTNTEVHPCHTIEKGKNGSKDIVEQCEPEQAEFWSVYVHLNEGGVDCVADCDTEEEANEFAEFLEKTAKQYLI